MKLKIVLTAALVVCGLSLAQAQDMSSTNSSRWDSGDLYRPGDITLQAFGVGTISEYTLNHLSGSRIQRNGHLGLGAGLEYFFTKYIGIEGEGFSETTHGSFVNDAGGNLVFRWPIGETGLAPYIFGGGGHEFYPLPNNNYGDGGAGLEFRFTHNLGIFADARYVQTEHTGCYALGRLGFNFTF